MEEQPDNPLPRRVSDDQDAISAPATSEPEPSADRTDRTFEDVRQQLDETRRQLTTEADELLSAAARDREAATAELETARRERASALELRARIERNVTDATQALDQAAQEAESVVKRAREEAERIRAEAAESVAGVQETQRALDQRLAAIDAAQAALEAERAAQRESAAAAQQFLQDAFERAAALQAGLTPEPWPRANDGDVGPTASDRSGADGGANRSAAELAEAERQAATVMEAAEAAAKRRLAEAEQEAARRVEQAERVAARRAEQADQQAAERLAEAEREAAEQLAEARSIAAAITARARPDVDLTRLPPGPAEPAAPLVGWPDTTPADSRAPAEPPQAPPTNTAPGAADETDDPTPGEGRRRGWTRGLRLGLLIVGVLLASQLFRSFVATPYTVARTSMAPELQESDRLLVNRLAYEVGDPQRGDVVAIDGTLAPGADTLVKRVIGLPGEEVSARDGHVVIDGKPLEESWLEEGTVTSPFTAVTVPDDAVFVLGDNRAVSDDSRRFGTVPYDMIVGRAELIYWPPGRVGGI